MKERTKVEAVIETHHVRIKCATCLAQEDIFSDSIPKIESTFRTFMKKHFKCKEGVKAKGKVKANAA